MNLIKSKLIGTSEERRRPIIGSSLSYSTGTDSKQTPNALLSSERTDGGSSPNISGGGSSPSSSNPGSFSSTSNSEPALTVHAAQMLLNSKSSSSNLTGVSPSDNDLKRDGKDKKSSGGKSKSPSLGNLSTGTARALSESGEVLEKDLNMVTQSPRAKKWTLRSKNSRSEASLMNDNPTSEMRSFFQSIPQSEECVASQLSKAGRYFLTPSYLCFLDTESRGHTVPLREVFQMNKRGKSSGGYFVEFVSVKDENSKTFPGMSSSLYRTMEQYWGMFADDVTNLSNALKCDDVERVTRLFYFADKGQIPLRMNEKDNDGSYPIHSAFKSGNVSVINLFLGHYQQKEMDINIKDRLNWTILHCATYHATGKPSDDQILRRILDFPGILIDVPSVDGNTPLHYFCQKSSSPSCQDLMDLLLKKGASVNRRNVGGETPLHKAIFNPSVRVLMLSHLIASGANVNISTSHGDTALHYAVHLGRKDIIKILLNAGADATLASNKKLRPMELALQLEQTKIAEIIKRAEDLKAWLAAIQMDHHYLKFMKEELYLDALTELIETEKMVDELIESLNLGLTMGSRLTLKKAILTLLETHRKVKEEKHAEAKSEASSDFKEKLNKVKHQGREPVTPGSELERAERIRTIMGMGEGSRPDWLIEHNKLEYTKKLGSGTSGKVYKGLYNGEKVAIKVLKTEDQAMEQEFRKEFAVMNAVRAPQIVHFIGACLEPKLCMVMEYCGKGSLYHLLKVEIPDWSKSIRFAMEITMGLAELHNFNPPIVHRDLKSLNVLITDDDDVKLTDFGLARFDTSDNLRTLNNMVGTIGWTAPELLTGSKFTKESDIYSLAIVFWELFIAVAKGAYQQPYADLKLNDLQIMIQTSENGVRPGFPTNFPPPLRGLMCLMWHGDTSKRPGCQVILEKLEECLRDLEAEK